MYVDRDYTRARPTFGQWLLDQARRQDAIGELARVAVTDRRFPRAGDWKAISCHLNETGADPDMHEALADAELDYHAL